MTHSADIASARRAIREKVIELARRRGASAVELADTDVIPETGLLDSVAIMELIIWFETTFDLTIPQTDLNLENLGTVEAMAAYLQRNSSTTPR